MGKTPQELGTTMDSRFGKIEGKTEVNRRTTLVAENVALWFGLGGRNISPPRNIRCFLPQGWNSTLRNVSLQIKALLASELKTAIIMKFSFALQGTRSFVYIISIGLIRWLVGFHTLHTEKSRKLS